ncbi:MAG: hypothetical protein JNK29_17475 [Anaerolineales bacterium]|nr:hypothetical protein [Anaerolineales bacterium]
MTVQMYLIQPKDREADQARETIAEYIAQRGGFILMATSYGSLIAAFDDRHLEAVKAHYLVEFASGVTLNLNAPGAEALRQLFAENVAAQLVERGLTQPGRPAANAPPPTASGGFPPGYRPLRWPTRQAEEGDE